MEKGIYSAITKIMGDVGAIEKTRKNEQGKGYLFRGIDDVYAALQPLFVKYGVYLVPKVLETCREERESKNGGTLIYTRLTVQYTFYAQDGSSFEAVIPGEAMDTGDKSSNKAMSAAMKICCLQIFCVPTEEEKDTEYDSHEIQPKQKPRDFWDPGFKSGGNFSRTEEKDTDGGWKPSEAQLKRLYAISKSSHWSDAAVKDYLIKLGVQSSSMLSRSQYDTVCQHISQNPMGAFGP
jgi:hypothetical protein